MYRKVKIITTIGPSSGNYDTIYKLIQEGVDGFRINFSHGEPKQWDEWIKMVREVSTKLEKEVALIGDIPGPQIRIGNLPVQEIKAKETVKLVFGEETNEMKTIPIPIKKV
ncbi:MAG: pyruvate kinase, partial [Thermoprotei archaeon]